MLNTTLGKERMGAETEDMNVRVLLSAVRRGAGDNILSFKSGSSFLGGLVVNCRTPLLKELLIEATRGLMKAGYIKNFEGKPILTSAQKGRFQEAWKRQKRPYLKIVRKGMDLEEKLTKGGAHMRRMKSSAEMPDCTYFCERYILITVL